jgi:hypothetical protein
LEACTVTDRSGMDHTRRAKRNTPQAGLKEIDEPFSFTLIRRGGSEGVASQQNCLGPPCVSLVPCIPNPSRGDGNQVGYIGGVRVVILEAEATGNLEFTTRGSHAVDTNDMREIQGMQESAGELRVKLQASSLSQVYNCRPGEALDAVRWQAQLTCTLDLQLCHVNFATSSS